MVMIRVWLQIMVMGSLLVLSSCIKEDFDNITSQYEWQPSFSFPLSTVILNTGDYKGGLTFLEEYNQSAIVEISEEVAFNFSEIFLEPLNGESVEVEQIMFRLEIINDFPGEPTVYANFLDDNHHSISSLLSIDPFIISPPQLDDNGNVINSERIIRDEYILKNEIENLNDAKFILLRVFMQNIDKRQSVLNRINEYNLEVGIGVRAGVKAQVDLY
jgi:hypothetical protein